MPKAYYWRHLPHWQPDAAIVTFRVRGSLPKTALAKIRQMRDEFKADATSEATLPANLLVKYKKVFSAYDDELDQDCGDPDHPSCIFKHPQAARIMRDRIKHGMELKRFILHRYCIMPNHVHLLIEPLPMALPDNYPMVISWPATSLTLIGDFDPNRRRVANQFWPLEKIMKAMKGAAARYINQHFHRRGPLFQEENFDHWIRDEQEYLNVIRYIDENPVTAKLCVKARSWPWGSAGEGMS